MTKDDFYPGQKVYVLQVLNCGNKTLEQRTYEAEVKSVGRKYITVSFIEDMKFDISNGFKEVTRYSPSYKLYLAIEDIQHEYQRLNDEDFVQKSFRWESNVIKRMSDEDLASIIEIIRKYVK